MSHGASTTRSRNKGKKKPPNYHADTSADDECDDEIEHKLNLDPERIRQFDNDVNHMYSELRTVPDSEKQPKAITIEARLQNARRLRLMARSRISDAGSPSLPAVVTYQERASSLAKYRSRTLSQVSFTYRSSYHERANSLATPRDGSRSLYQASSINRSRAVSQAITEHQPRASSTVTATIDRIRASVLITPVAHDHVHEDLGCHDDSECHDDLYPDCAKVKQWKKCPSFLDFLDYVRGDEHDSQSSSDHAFFPGRISGSKSSRRPKNEVVQLAETNGDKDTGRSEIDGGSDGSDGQRSREGSIARVRQGSVREEGRDRSREGIVGGNREGNVATSREGGVATSRDGSMATNRHGGVATSRDGSVATNREGGVATSREGGVATSRDGSVATSRDGSVATSRQGSVATGRQSGVATGRQDGVATNREGGVATSREGGVATSREGGVATSTEGSVVKSTEGGVKSREGGVATSRDGSVATSVECDVATSTQGGVASSRLGSEATSKQGGVATSREGGVATSSEGGVATSRQGGVATSTEGSVATRAEGGVKSREGSVATSTKGCEATSTEGSEATSTEGSVATGREGSVERSIARDRPVDEPASIAMIIGMTGEVSRKKEAEETGEVKAESRQSITKSEFILGDQDPWHISARLPHLTTGLLDSIGERNLFLHSREQMYKTLENNKAILKESEQRLWSIKRCVPPAETSVPTVKTRTGSSKSFEHESRAISEYLPRVSVNGSTVYRSSATSRGRKSSQKVCDFMTVAFSPIDSNPKLKADADVSGANAKKGETLKLKSTADTARRPTGNPSRLRERTESHPENVSKSGLWCSTESVTPQHTADTENLGGLKDEDLPDDIPEKVLFELMGFQEVFDIYKLKNSYSFERMFAHRQSAKNHYSKLLAVFQKPYPPGKKKKQIYGEKLGGGKGTGRERSKWDSRQVSETKCNVKGSSSTNIYGESEGQVTSVQEMVPAAEPSPMIIGQMREFRFLKKKHHLPLPALTEPPFRKVMRSAEHVRDQLIHAMEMFVVRKERATTTRQFQSKVSVTFTRRLKTDGGCPLMADARLVVAGVCHTLADTYVEPDATLVPC